MNDYAKLKSGTDIRGRAIASDGAPALLTETAVADLACAFAVWLLPRAKSSRLKIAVCRDCRITGEAFASAILRALRRSGAELFDCGLFSTPAAFFTTQFPSMTCDGAIMITASHHPKDINGLKFFTTEGGVNSAELDEIIALANNGQKPEETMTATVIRRDFLRLYCDALTDVLRKGTGLFLPLKGMRIAVDAGHGAGGFYAERVLAPLGADISPSQFLEPDGTFPAHPPNPENAEAMASLSERVVSTGADIGIIFDADVDRCAIVAGDGTPINRCALIALAAAMVLPENPGATIVTDSVTTQGLREFIEQHGGVQRRFRRGYRNVIDEAKRLNEQGVNAPLAIESSGHAAFADHFFLDDGAYFVTKALVLFANLRRDGMELTDLIAGLRVPLEETDIRLDLVGDDWRLLAEKIISRLKEMSERMLTISQDNYEGVRAYVSHAKGYFIVRTSVHDPVLPIYIESDKKGGAKSIARLLYSFLSGFSGIDCAPLKDFAFVSDSESDQQPAEEPVEEPVEETPVYDEPAEEYTVETADEVAEEYTEEVVDEEPAEECTEEVVDEEPAEEYAQEALDDGSVDEYMEEVADEYAESDDEPNGQGDEF